MPCRSLALATALLLVAAPRAQAPVPGTCALGTDHGTLGVSDVAVGLYNTGSLFFGASGQAQYVVPRASGLSPVFAAGLWVGGRVGSEIRFAGTRYANFQFWPGPLGADGRPVNPADCSAYDRIWVVSVADVAAYDAGGPATPDLAQWPYQLGAGVIDGDGNPDNYDLAGGDRPVIYGSQTAFWVMNDVGNVKTGAVSAAIGLEVRVHAFVIASQEADLARGTFYRYTLVYRGSEPLEGARMSLFADPDLGNSTDDYLHTDTTRGMGVVYNADELDETATGYGPQPPAFGIDLLDGLGASSYFISGYPGAWDPNTAVEYYNYQQGLWVDGVPVREGGDGRSNPGGAITTFAFPGDPVTGAFWSEENTGAGPSTPGDRRFVVTSPAFTLQPGDVRTFDVAMLYGRAESRLASVTALRAASDRVQALHDSGALFASVPPGTSPTAPGPTTLLSPPDGVDLGEVATVHLDWTAVPGATEYRVEIATDAAFADPVYEVYVPADSLVFDVTPNLARTYFWRVTAYNQWVAGAPSEVRRFTADGPYAPAILGVEEWDAAGPITTNADGSATDPSLLASLNSTRTQPPGYVVGAQGALADDPDQVLMRLDWNSFVTGIEALGEDYEVRWVEPAEGHAVFHRAAGTFLTCWEVGTLDSTGAAVSNVQEVAAPMVGGLPRMPFQLWEIAPDGSERPVQAVVLQDDGDGCYGFTPNVAGAPLSRTQYERIYATRVLYDEAALLANPAAVFAETQILDADHQAFGRLQVVPYLPGPARPPQAGSRIRIVTTDPPPGTATEGPAEPAAGVAVEAARPNPIRGEASLRFTVGSAGPARVVLYDVLGREVAVLLDGAVAAGLHTVALDGRRLAPGAYVVVVEAGEARASRLVTVVR